MDTAQGQAERVDEHMTFAAHDFLAGVIARLVERRPRFWAALALRLSRIAAIGLAPVFRFTHSDIESLVHAHQRARAVEQDEMAVHDALGWQVLGQRALLAAGRQHVKEAVQHLAHVDFRPASPASRRRHERRDSAHSASVRSLG